MCTVHQEIYRTTRSAILLLFAGLGNVLAQTPEWEWARSVNSNNFEIVQDVVTDPVTDDVYMVGTWSSDLSAVFPVGANPSTDFSSTYGGRDGYVAKYDKDGNFIWAFKAGGNHDDEISGISIDTAGNIYVTGTFGEGINYFSGTSAVTPVSTISNTHQEDFFIAKYNPDGEFIWIRRSETDAEDIAGLSIDVSVTSVFASGTYKGICSFGPLSITTTFGSLDIFLIRYDFDGNEQWVISGGSNNNDFAPGITADVSHVYIAGHFDGNQMDFTDTGGTTVSTLINGNSGKDDIFLASYDLNGVFSWSQRISSNDEDECYGITSDSDSIYLTGAISTLANFPSFSGNPVSATDHKDIFISSHAKSDGNTGWAYSIPCTDGGDEYGRAIDQGIGGDLFITGFFKKNISFPDATTLSSTGDQEEVFIAAYSQDGIFEWAISAGSNGKDYGYGISAGSEGTLYAVGSYENLMSFDLLTIPDDGNENGYLAKLQEPCTDAIGGIITASQTEICMGEIVQLSLTGHDGNITWQQSPSGADAWTPISGETLDTVIVAPTIDTDYRAYLSSGTCNPDSSNVITVLVF
jgi:hypothetical protein